MSRMRWSVLLALVVATAIAGGCYVHTHPPGYQEAPPPPPPPPDAPPAPGPGSEATPAPAPAGFSFRLSTTRARRGEDVSIFLPAPYSVEVFFNGRPLPMRATDEGKTLIVTIPGDAVSGYVEVAFQGQRYRSEVALTVLP